MTVIVCRQPAVHRPDCEVDESGHHPDCYCRYVEAIGQPAPLLPPPEMIFGDPETCRHGVLDECVGVQWGYEDCLGCGKRFPMRDDL